MCSGARSSSANGAMARRASSALGWSTSSRSVLSLWTISGPSGTRQYPELVEPVERARAKTPTRAMTTRAMLMLRAIQPQRVHFDASAGWSFLVTARTAKTSAGIPVPQPPMVSSPDTMSRAMVLPLRDAGLPCAGVGPYPGAGAYPGWGALAYGVAPYPGWAPGGGWAPGALPYGDAEPYPGGGGGGG